MTELKRAVVFEIEECIKYQVFIPPLVMPDGRKLKIMDSTGHVNTNLPPLKFLVHDPDNNTDITAVFYPMEMRWEVAIPAPPKE